MTATPEQIPAQKPSLDSDELEKNASTAPAHIPNTMLKIMPLPFIDHGLISDFAYCNHMQLLHMKLSTK